MVEAIQRKPLAMPGKAETAQKRTIAMLETVEVRRVHTPIHDDGGMTFGQMLDQQLAEKAREGIEVQTVSINFEREDWYAFAETVR